MENIALIDSFSEFKDEKFIDRVTLMSILEEVFRNTLKRKYGDDDNFDIIINPDKGDLEIWRNRIVVEDDSVEDENQEISLSEARKIEPDFEVGEDVSEEVKLIDLGRRTVLALRQNLVSRINEHDNGIIYKQFIDLIGEIYTAEVHHIRHNVVILLDDEGNELIMPKDRQIPSDFYRKGDSIRGIIESVELKGNKPSIVMSRTSPKFLEKLFEQDIPEVFDGLISVKKVVRIPGEKAKVAVDSYDDRIDPVGACVGMRGSRVQAVVEELQGEKIDIVTWSDNQATFLANALAPSEVSKIFLYEEKNKVEVVIPDEQLSLAIGRKGQNVKLASSLTNLEIDILTEEEESERRQIEFKEKSAILTDLLDVEDVIAQLLVTEGYVSVESIANETEENLEKIEGFDEELANEIVLRAKNALKEQEVENIKIVDEKIKDQDLKDLNGMTIPMLALLAKENIVNLSDFADLASYELIDKEEGIFRKLELEEEIVNQLIMDAREKSFS